MQRSCSIASEAVAAGALEVLREAGRSVPDDVGIVWRNSA